MLQPSPRSSATESAFQDGFPSGQVGGSRRRRREPGPGSHAAEYDIEPTQVAVWGESAGGSLAAMVGTTNNVQAFDAGENLDQSSEVQAVLDKFGPSDLALIAADFDAKTRAAYSGPDTTTAKSVYGPNSRIALTEGSPGDKAANPATYANPSNPPFLLFHGIEDRLVSPSQTLLLHSTLRAAGVDSIRYVIDGAGHGDLSAFSGGDAPSVALWSTTTVMARIVTFFNMNLKK